MHKLEARVRADGPLYEDAVSECVSLASVCMRMLYSEKEAGRARHSLDQASDRGKDSQQPSSATGPLFAAFQTCNSCDVARATPLRNRSMSEQPT